MILVDLALTVMSVGQNVVLVDLALSVMSVEHNVVLVDLNMMWTGPDPDPGSLLTNCHP